MLPRSFDISTGFVIDATGSISRQIDLVIYRNDFHPVFEIGGIKHFMVESVVAVMENKASIAATKDLNEALENIKSVKALDRTNCTNCGKNYIIDGYQRGPSCDADDFQHQVFGAIVTELSLSRTTLMAGLLGFLRANPKRIHWPNVYTDVRSLSATYLRSVAPPVTTVIPSEAKYLWLTDDLPDEGFVSPLIALATEVLNLLRVAPKIDFKPTDYLLERWGKVGLVEKI